MARLPRFKILDDEAYYHVFNRVAGPANYFPFRQPQASRKFLKLMHFYVDGYSCRLAGYVLMGNHYHLIVHLEKPRQLTRLELQERARHFYPREIETRLWGEKEWRHFNKRLFDLTGLMHNIDTEYSRWHNRRYRRRGPVWANRFQSILLQDRQAVQDCLLYLELNPPRAGLVKRPEQWKASSARDRWRGRESQLIPLEELFEGGPEDDVFAEYRGRLMYRGMEPSKDTDTCIPEWVVEKERLRGFRRPGVFRKRLRFLTEGVVLGPRSTVKSAVQLYFNRGIFRKRQDGVAHRGGLWYTLRAQSASAGFQ